MTQKNKGFGWVATYGYRYGSRLYSVASVLSFLAQKERTKEKAIWRETTGHSRRSPRFHTNSSARNRFLFAYFLFFQRESRDGKRRSRVVGSGVTRYYWDRGYTVLNESNGSGTLARSYVGRNMALLSSWRRRKKQRRIVSISFGLPFLFPKKR